MSKGAQNRASMAIVALAVLAVGGGLFIVGGPARGRGETHDSTRINDLSRIISQAQCLVSNGVKLSATITTTDACPDEVRLTDPYSGTAYRIEQVDASNLRLCADFEIEPDQIGSVMYGGSQRNGDCIVAMIEDYSLSGLSSKPDLDPSADGDGAATSGEITPLP